MRKIALVFLLLFLLITTALPLRVQTRPRRVGQSGSAPPASTTTAPTYPPVLKDRSSAKAPRSQPQTAPSPGNQIEEVGQGDVVRINTSLVTVPVSVSDRDGKYIPNLRKEDFRIYEDGSEQQIAYFASVEKPFTVALLIDTSGSTRFRLDEIQDAAISFVDQLRSDDRVMVVSFDDDVTILTEPTSNRSILRDVIRRTHTGDGTRLYDAVDLVINRYFNRITGRKAIVLFTDGVDTTSRQATYRSNVHDIEEMDVLVYPVQYDTFDDVNAGGQTYPTQLPDIILQWPFPFPRPFPNRRRGRGSTGGGGSAGSSRGDYARADSYLNDLAQKTGGRLYRTDNSQNLARAFALVAEELRRQYSLGYYPKNTAQAGQRRQIKVRVNNRPNLVVRARDSYISNPSSNAARQQLTSK